jgi:uncharacterized protein (DUF1800 family)
MNAMSEIPVYTGSFGKPQAERLLWRAGFGPRRGEATALARLGLDDAVRSLTHPPVEKLVGRAPHDEKGRPLAPQDAWGHDVLWWLDRMVRTNRPLVERMTLVWHDWFATSLDGVGSQKLMLRQNGLLRGHALGSFKRLLLDITADPAMLLWLSGVDNDKDKPNENYGRELMELFTLGEGQGYTEDDVREQARALTGFVSQWSKAKGPHDFRWERKRWDRGVKTIFGQRGTFDWRDACNLCLQNQAHATYFVRRLWSYFIADPPDESSETALIARYRADYRILPVLEAILRHPAFYTGPRLVKPPIVFTAGLLRGLGRTIETTDWSWLTEGAGQRLFMPPNVAGWDERHWLDTATFRGRWLVADRALSPFAYVERKGRRLPHVPSDPAKLVRAAEALLGYPEIRAETRSTLEAYAGRALATAAEDWQKRQWPPIVLNAVRQLLAVSPDYQTA